MVSAFGLGRAQRSHSLVIALLACILIVAWVTRAPAQRETQPPSGQAILSGTVTDSKGAVIPGATVVLLQGSKALAPVVTDEEGKFTFHVAPGDYTVRASLSGFITVTRAITVARNATRVTLAPMVMQPGGVSDVVNVSEQVPLIQAGAGGGRGGGVVGGIAPPPIQAASGERSSAVNRVQLENLPAPGTSQNMMAYVPVLPGPGYMQPGDTARYAHVEAGRFHTAAEDPLSTFGADVDTASYTNVRRFLSQGQLPPTDAVRVEEFVNYFKFDYAAPRGPHPIGLTTELGDCPWAPTHKLVLIGARAASPVKREIEGRNLVLLVDVSGSMSPANRLPMIKSALSVFVDTLDPDDRLTIVTYAGYSGVALPTTPARQRTTILSAIASLGAGGSTNGAQGIVTAYRAARQAFIRGGVNRVILATDGDFNVGVTSQQDLLTLIEQEKQSGVFLSVLGVGDNNLQDATMEMLADKGNGHYAYLDSLQEARRVLVQEADSTLETVAKEVKFQVEFNPAQVTAWKLIGYENRKLAAEDFNNDRKDGGEMGAGHTVTVLYEVVPVGAATGDDSPDVHPSVDPLRYQQPAPSSPARTTVPARTGEWMTVKVRYQLPEGDTSRLIEQPIRGEATLRPQFLPFASAVADFAMLLRDSRPMGSRWNALTSRLNEMRRTPDRDAVAELVGLAQSLKRVQ